MKYNAKNRMKEKKKKQGNYNTVSSQNKKEGSKEGKQQQQQWNGGVNYMNTEMLPGTGNAQLKSHFVLTLAHSIICGPTSASP